jgi:hypothetical protein
MIKANLVELGREKTTKLVEVPNLKSLRDEISPYLPGKFFYIDETPQKEIFYISVGTRIVGTIEVLEGLHHLDKLRKK